MLCPEKKNIGLQITVTGEWLAIGTQDFLLQEEVEK